MNGLGSASTGADSAFPEENQSSEDDVESEEILNKLIKFFKKNAFALDEDLLGIDDYIRDIEIDRTNIRCINTSILAICGFLLPILFGIFYFIVKDSSSIHVQVHWLIITILIISIILLFITIFFSVEGIRAPKPPEQFFTKLDKYDYIYKRRENERSSSERSILSLGFSLVLILLTFIGIYYCILAMPNQIIVPNQINETVNATVNASLNNLSPEDLRNKLAYLHYESPSEALQQLAIRDSSRCN